MSAFENNTNLLPSPGVFIGRNNEISKIKQWMGEGKRLVTIMGPGGAGKTTLLEEVGRRQQSTDEAENNGGVWFIALNEARSLADVVLRTAEALNIAAETDVQTSLEMVGRAIAARQKILLLFDNFEQVAQFGCETLAYWLRGAPRATFIVSSRERLLLPDEQLITVGALNLPPKNCASITAFANSEAGRLFLTRIGNLNPSYSPPEDMAPILTKIVWRL
ncbi:MAG: AAA family ATPase, partial [Proteobacteria bacterium]|nr:AAA family ATPase [Pseudomonadota bacterium]